MTKTNSVNTGVPAGTETPRQGDNRIRALAAGIVELMQVDHYMGSPTGTAYDSDDAGKHSKVTLVEAKTIADQPNNTIARDSAGDLWFKDGSGNQIQLTDGGKLNGAALKDDSVNAAMIELLNNTFLTQKDSAGTARNLIGINASNQTILGGTGAHDVRLSDATASGDDDRHIADKGYVDGKIDAMLVVAHDYTLLCGSSGAYTTTLSTRSVSVTKGKQYLILVSGSTSTSDHRPQIALFVNGTLKADIEIGAVNNHNQTGKGFFLQNIYTATSTGSINVQIKADAAVLLRSAQVLVIQIK